jgi:hypothetical protein
LGFWIVLELVVEVLEAESEFEYFYEKQLLFYDLSTCNFSFFTIRSASSSHPYPSPERIKTSVTLPLYSMSHRSFTVPSF